MKKIILVFLTLTILIISFSCVEPDKIYKNKDKYLSKRIILEAKVDKIFKFKNENYLIYTVGNENNTIYVLDTEKKDRNQDIQIKAKIIFTNETYKKDIAKEEINNYLIKFSKLDIKNAKMETYNILKFVDKLKINSKEFLFAISFGIY